MDLAREREQLRKRRRLLEERGGRPDLIVVLDRDLVGFLVVHVAARELPTQPGVDEPLGRLERVTTAVVNAVSVPVTAKIRIGWDKNSTNAPDVARVLEHSGVRWIAVHARSRSEKFTGQAHWEAIRDVKQATSLPVIGNGDVKTPEDAKRMVDETGCDAVMVGRGSFGNPWLFGRAQRLLDGAVDPGPEPTPRERIETAIAHLHEVAAKKGDYAAVLMRKHVAWYVRGLYDNSSLCRAANHAQSPAETEALLRAYLDGIERHAAEAPPHNGNGHANGNGHEPAGELEGAAAAASAADGSLAAT